MAFPFTVQETTADTCPFLPLSLFSFTSLRGNDINIPEEAVRSMNPKLWIWVTIISLNSDPVSRRVWLIFNQALSDIQSKGEIPLSSHGTSHSQQNILFANHPRSCFIKQLCSTSQLNIPGIDLQIKKSVENWKVYFSQWFLLIRNREKEECGRAGKENELPGVPCARSCILRPELWDGHSSKRYRHS